jgi:hypothetical protein
MQIPLSLPVQLRISRQSLPKAAKGSKGVEVLMLETTKIPSFPFPLLAGLLSGLDED